MEYHFREIEKKWQEIWAKNKTFKAEDSSSKPKYYVLDMFPYPSGAGLHVGHPLGYIASDIMARYKRHKGFNVLHPMGYDSFGLPAEQYAIQTGQHPAVTTEQNIKRYREQLDKIGFSFDWDREVRTSDPEYYKWTQWIFIELFNSWFNNASNKTEKIDSLIAEFEKNGNAKVNAVCDEDVKQFSAAEWKAFSEKEKSDVLMAYRVAYLGEAYVNWCPALGTVLANDEVKDGVSERGGHPVERKLMKQWSMRITAYAQRLLDGLDTIDWTESLKETQRNWIGRSEGATIKFKVYDSENHLEVYTTRPDTIFGVSFVTIAPEHELVFDLTIEGYRYKVEEYIERVKNRTERERQADVNTVSGVFTGKYVEHPFTKRLIPIWIGDYVIGGYGTGAVMAVPAHDERDFKFASHFGLEKPQVIVPNKEHDLAAASWDDKEGKMINSDFLNGLEVKAAIKKAIEEIEKRGLGKGKVNYRLRDAVFGRQRYWGEPIPIYYKDGIPHAIPMNELPLVLPEVDKYLPTEDGEPPLARANNWKYKGQYEYELTTMPGWAGSSWYFLRYMDANNKTAFADKKLIDYWKNVDLYIGGSEHATGHLLYVRFWTKALKDLGYINIEEPAQKLINQGMIQGTSEKINKISSVPSKSELIARQIVKETDGTNNGQIVAFWRIKNPEIQEARYIPEEIKTIYLSADIINPKEDLWKFSKDKNADVNNVSNSALDIKKHIGWWKEDNSAAFVCEGGYWYKGKFHSFNNGGSEIFKTSQEVEKMSKSKYNVVSPVGFTNEKGEQIPGIIDQFGADTLRLYEMFLGPLEQSKPWNTNGITGVSGFLKKLWRLYVNGISEDAPTKAELKTLHTCIKKISEDIERFSFNTSVSNFMICCNELTDQKCNKRQILEPLLILISPYAPHITEELWSVLGHKESIAFEKFPEFNPAFLIEDNFNYPVSFNGKMRFNLELPTTLSPQEIEKIVLEHENSQKYLEGKTPKKVIVVPKKIVNIVV